MRGAIRVASWAVAPCARAHRAIRLRASCSIRKGANDLQTLQSVQSKLCSIYKPYVQLCDKTYEFTNPIFNFVIKNAWIYKPYVQFCTKAMDFTNPMFNIVTKTHENMPETRRSRGIHTFSHCCSLQELAWNTMRSTNSACFYIL